ALALTAGEGRKRLGGEVRDADLLERGPSTLAILLPRSARATHAVVAPHEHHVLDLEGKVVVHMVALRDVAEPEPVGAGDGARHGRERTEDRPQDGGLPGA